MPVISNSAISLRTKQTFSIHFTLLFCSKIPLKVTEILNVVIGNISIKRIYPVHLFNFFFYAFLISFANFNTNSVEFYLNIKYQKRGNVLCFKLSMFSFPTEFNSVGK